MDLEFYTVKQVARRLDCEPDDVEHLIERYKLPVHIFFKKESLIITSGRVGRAIVNYEGVMKPSRQQIFDLFLEMEEVLIDEEFEIDVSGILDWNENPPIDAETYVREADVALDSWDSWPFSRVKDLTKVTAISFDALQHDHYQSMHRLEREKELASSGHTDLPEYLFSGPSAVHKSEFVVLHDDLIAFQQSLAKSSQNKSTYDSASFPATPVVIVNRQRQNELHLLILKVLKARPSLSASGVWQLLANDAVKADRQYDEDEILIEVTKDVMTWMSSYDNLQNMKKGSWASTVSRLKKELKA